MKNITVSDDYKFLLKRVCETVSEARRRQGLSQRQLAKLAGKSQAVIAKIEKAPPPDLSLRSIYEMTKHIPISLTEVMHEAEKEVDGAAIRNDPDKIDLRLGLMMEEIQSLDQEEQKWVTEMLESILARTNKAQKSTDITDKRVERQAAQSF